MLPWVILGIRKAVIVSDRISVSSIRAHVSPTKTQRIITGKKTSTERYWNHLVLFSPFTDGERLRVDRWSSFLGPHILLVLEPGPGAHVSREKAHRRRRFRIVALFPVSMQENVGDTTTSREQELLPLGLIAPT